MTLIALHNEKPPEAAAWDAYLVQIRTLLAEVNHDRTRVAGLTFTDGGAPNSAQRTALRQALGGETIRAAMVTDSTAAKAVISVFGLFVSGVRVFSPVDWRDAVTHAGLNAGDELGAVLQGLRSHVGLARSVPGCCVPDEAVALSQESAEPPEETKGHEQAARADDRRRRGRLFQVQDRLRGAAHETDQAAGCEGREDGRNGGR
jgi:hypothetical protein